MASSENEPATFQLVAYTAFPQNWNIIIFIKDAVNLNYQYSITRHALTPCSLDIGNAVKQHTKGKTTLWGPLEEAHGSSCMEGRLTFLATSPSFLWRGVRLRLHYLTYCASPLWCMKMSVEQSVDWMTLETEILGEKPAPVPFRPPQIPHDRTWSGTRAATMGSRRLTAWTTARPNQSVWLESQNNVLLNVNSISSRFVNVKTLAL
jgi:hypothetical protein